ncbi:MAG: carboxypeptidase regulatory-like domain-containing protein [Gemmatimonadaceae bacterium]
MVGANTLLTRTVGALVLTLGALFSPPRLSAQYTVAGQVTLQELTGKNKKDIASAIVWLVPQGLTVRGADTIPAHTSIAMRGREFVPHIRLVTVGGSIAFPNQDPFSHNVFSNSDLGQFDLGLYRRRESRIATFPTSGVYAVYCNIHARMTSFVVAVPTRLVTTVDKNGEFVLRDVPPGTYEVHGWHERADETRSRIAVSANQTGVVVALDARGFVTGQHLNKFGQPYTSTRADRY